MRRALIVGINDYPQPKAELKWCVKDAIAVSRVLEANGDGSPNFGIKLVKSPGVDVTRPLLRQYIETLFSGKPEIALFYFSGHGLIKSTGGYIVTRDAQKYDEGISMDEILLIANQSEAREKIIILDCCHSGALGTPKITGNNTAVLSEGLTVLTASRSNEIALEIKGSGVFTSLVVEALEGGASNLCGQITLGSVYAFVDKAIGEWFHRPIFKTNVTRFSSLRSVRPPITLHTLRKLCKYFPNPKARHRLDPEYEFTSKQPDRAKVSIFKTLQKLASVGLVVPVGAKHMYYAAMKSKACRLTPLGCHYWRLVHEGKI